MPAPRGKEKESDFIERCMGDEEMNEKFSNIKQRAAVCYSYWNRAKKNEDFREKVRQYIKEFRAEATLNKWIIQYNGKNVTVNDLPPMQQKVFGQMKKNLQRDGIFNKIKGNDPKSPDMILKTNAVEVYDESGKLLKRYKL